mgnify:FL=1
MEKSNETIFKDAIEDTGYSVRSYSGRGMYGKSCLGFETTRYQNSIQAVAEIIGNLAETCRFDEELELQDFIEMFSDVQQDSLGLGQIIYFPDIAWEKDWEESDTEEEDEDDEN